MDLRHRIWIELGRATVDRHHEWRTPVLASASLEGWPDARTVVLREVDASRGELVVYTDGRSPKVAELRAQPTATFVFWSKRLSWQLRARVHVTVQIEGPAVEARWQRVRHSPSAGDYLGLAPPGAPLAEEASAVGVGGTVTSADLPVHFAVLTARVLEMDWLELARTGHRRALLRDGSREWRVP